MNPFAEKVVLFEDEAAYSLEPLSLTRPVWDLRCGIRDLGEKISAFFPGIEIYGYARPYLESILENPINQNGNTIENALYINGALVPDTDLSDAVNIPVGSAWVRSGRVLAFRGRKPEKWKAGTQFPVGQFNIMEAPENAGKLINYTWHLVNALNGEIAREARELRDLGQHKGMIHSTATIIHEQEVFIGSDCRIAPGVVIDATYGPVVIDENVTIGANAVIEGASYIGYGTQVKPLTHIRGSCLGEECRIGGEISVSIMQGYTNKQHGGFLGHSFIGSWCNLGSGTETSNLKNNYSPVKVQVGPEIVDTSEMFVGLTMGDHSKTAIGSVFNTGSVVGVGCIVFGAGFPPRFIPSFHWGGAEKLTPYPLLPTLETIRIVMGRRHKELSQAEIEVLTWIHENRNSMPGM